MGGESGHRHLDIDKGQSKIIEVIFNINLKKSS